MIKLDKIDVCAIARGINVLPMFTAAKNFVFSKFPTMPKKCPAMPMKFNVSNVTVVNNPTNEFNMSIKDHENHSMFYSEVIKSISPKLLPNGYYKSIILGSFKDDPNGFMFSWQAQLNHRMNDDVF
jgi:hypothetical protein